MHLCSSIINLKRRKKYLLEIIMVIILSILFLLTNVSLMINKTIYNINTKSINKRTISISGYVSNVDELYNIKHVNMVYDRNGSIPYSNDQLGDIIINPIAFKEYDNLEIIDGTKVLERFDLICPKKLIATNDSSDIEYTKNHTYDTKELMNKKFKEHLVKHTSDLVNNKIVDKVLAEKDIDYRIVGTYNNKKYMSSNNECFASLDTIESITSFIYIDNEMQQKSGKNIVVDKISNVNAVKEILKGKKYIVSDTFSFNRSFILVVEFISLALLAIILIAINLLLSFIIKRDITDRKKEILVYRSVGYAKNKISKIYSIEYIIRISISTMVSLLISISIFNILKLEYGLSFAYEGIEFAISPLSYVILVIISLFYSYLIMNKKLKSMLEQKGV